MATSAKGRLRNARKFVVAVFTSYLHNHTTYPHCFCSIQSNLYHRYQLASYQTLLIYRLMIYTSASN